GSELDGSGEQQGVSMALSEIRLYSRFDKPYSEPKALKRIHFSHSYTLCPDAPNADDGKLTLDALSFSYENSIEGFFTPYVFSYAHNPHYNTRAQDRWGRYQPFINECEEQDFPY